MKRGKLFLSHVLEPSWQRVGGIVRKFAIFELLHQVRQFFSYTL
jgi:hypothetical protein